MKIPVLVVLCCAWAMAAQEPPIDWVDPDTGHRVIRLTKEPGSASLYFHQYAYGGDKMIFTTREGISTVNLKTHEIEQVVKGRNGQQVVGRKNHTVYYTQDGSIKATNLDTKETREILKMPAWMRGGSGLAVNADETLLAGSSLQEGVDPRNTAPPQGPGPAQEGRLEARFNLKLPMWLYTVNIKTGEVKTFHPATDWLNHVQFSPTDPGLIMFCHEGPWHKLDRIWTIRTDGSGLRKIHTRTMDMEIAGHEFFGQDGKTIWYDLQTPKYKDFWLAGVVLKSGNPIRYHLKREEWSVHFNVSPNGKMFAGDGGGPNSVAAPGNGQWIYLFTPKGKGKEIQAEKLVNLAKHNYTLEPNVSFTPDAKWIVFRSNMYGPTQVYAVEVAKAKGKK